MLPSIAGTASPALSVEVGTSVEFRLMVVVFVVTVPLPLFEGFPVSFETEADSESLPTVDTPEPVILIEALAEFASVELTGLVTVSEAGTSVGALPDFAFRFQAIGTEGHAKPTNICRGAQDLITVCWKSFCSKASISILWVKEAPRGSTWAALKCLNSCDVARLALLA